MKRPVLITTVAILQFLLALVMAGTTIYLLWLAHSPKILAEPDGADAAHGLTIGAIATGIPTAISGISFWGLWKSKRWGWWLALVMNVIILATLAYGMVDENSVDMEEIVVTLCFMILPIFLLLPKVRKFYWTGPVPRVEASS